MSLVVRVLRILLLGLGLETSTAEAAAPVFDRLIVFGDSLSDTGNAGRFSNGPVWVEYLAQRLALPLEPARIGGGNFAIGNARLDPESGPSSLPAQVDLFLAMPPPQGRTLFVVFGGGNDLFAAVGTAGAEALADRAVAALTSIVSDLVDHGARDILLPNLPDIGMTPEIRSRGAEAVMEAGRLTARFDDALDRALVAFLDRPGLRLHRLDVRALAERVRTAPAAAGFADVSTPCRGTGQCGGCLFWDDVHPTTLGHARLAEAAYRVLQEKALPLVR
jgi:phospholipase/lecithinase/hemolysin